MAQSRWIYGLVLLSILAIVLALILRRTTEKTDHYTTDFAEVGAFALEEPNRGAPLALNYGV